jgi:hypothetical protein
MKLCQIPCIYQDAAGNVRIGQDPNGGIAALRVPNEDGSGNTLVVDNSISSVEVTGSIQVTDGVFVGGVLRLAPVAAPSSPSTGFYLYVDQADGKLKAKSSGGTVTTIANP